MRKLNYKLGIQSWVFTLALLLVGSMVTAQGISLFKAYQESWNSAVQEARNVQATISSAISQKLASVDLSLLGALDALSIEGLETLPPLVQQGLLFDRSSKAPFLGSMLVLGTDGTIRFDSASLVPRAVRLDDRDYFTAQKERDVGTYLSAPFASRLRNGEPSLALSRRVSDENGRFAGVIIATIRLSYFRSLIDQVKMGPRDVISILRRDGTMIMRSSNPDGRDFSGVNLGSTAIFQRILKTDTYFSAVAATDHVERFYVFSKLAELPLVISVGFSVADALAAWRYRAIVTASVTLALAVGVLVLVAMLQRQLAQSRSLEGLLQTAAVTDPLTGLANRRAFDDHIDRESALARRHGQPFSIALIDIDRFKTVNDSYGHAVGDRVIQAVGRQIRLFTRRPGDMSSRYGGEEFLVLLTNTPAEGAVTVAESIRNAIKATTVAANEEASLSVTVSIGVATLQPDATDTGWRSLFNRADAALYRAKNAGRDRVCLHGDDTQPSLDPDRWVGAPAT